MSTAKNDHTGDTIMSKPTSDKFRENMQLILENLKVRKGEAAKPTQPHQDKTKYKRKPKHPPTEDAC